MSFTYANCNKIFFIICNFQWFVKKVPFGNFWFYELKGNLNQFSFLGTSIDMRDTLYMSECGSNFRRIPTVIPKLKSILPEEKQIRAKLVNRVAQRFCFCWTHSTDTSVKRVPKRGKRWLQNVRSTQKKM